jgi:hypothetical protein
MNPPDWGGGTWDGVGPWDGVADDVEGDVDVDDGVDGWVGRVGVDMLRDPRLPEERLPPTRANASTVMNRNSAADTQTAATTNDRFFMVPPGSDAESVARYRGAPRASICPGVDSTPLPADLWAGFPKRKTQGAGRQISCTRCAKDERSGPA